MKYEEMLKRGMEKLSKSVKEERFRFPKIVARKEGNKTIIKNFLEIAKLLRREVKHLLKFFQRELATPGEIKGNSAVFLGKFNDRLLLNKLKEYIEYWVFCPACRRPDTILLREKKHMKMKCEACGIIVER